MTHMEWPHIIEFDAIEKLVDLHANLEGYSATFQSNALLNHQEERR